MQECFRLALCNATVAVGTYKSAQMIVTELPSGRDCMLAINSSHLNTNCTRASTAAPALVSSFLLVQNPLPQKSIKDEQMRTPPLPAS